MEMAASLSALKPLRWLPVSVWRAGMIVLAMLWLLWVLSKSVWLIYDAYSWSVPQATVGDAPMLVKRSVDIAALRDAHLFGEAGAEPVASTQEIAETTVSLKLVGVYGASDEAKASAIVEQPGGQQEIVFVGGVMPGNNGTLKQVFGDRIVFERAGRLETLRMEDATVQLANQVQTGDALVSTGMPMDKRKDAQLASRLAEVRERFQNDPTSIADALTIEPHYSNGVLSGYRLGPGKDRKLFARAGLQRNDLLRSVNGVPLDDPAKAYGLMNELQTADEVSLTIDRAGQLLTVQLPLNNP